jgi:Ca2+-dependent lipid-binding protein
MIFGLIFLLAFLCFIFQKKNIIWLWCFIIILICSCWCMNKKDENYKRMIKEGKQIDGLPSKYWE